MNTIKDGTCRGCLSTDRQILVIDDRASKQCFFQIINEMSMLYVNDERLQLCWECERYIKKWVRFKEQVKYVYRIMHDYGNSLPKHNQSTLITNKLENITIIPTSEDVDALQIKKEENYDYTELSDNYEVNLTQLDSHESDSLAISNTEDYLSNIENSNDAEKEIVPNLSTNIDMDNNMSHDEMLEDGPVNSNDGLLVNYNVDTLQIKTEENHDYTELSDNYEVKLTQLDSHESDAFAISNTEDYLSNIENSNEAEKKIVPNLSTNIDMDNNISNDEMLKDGPINSDELLVNYSKDFDKRKAVIYKDRFNDRASAKKRKTKKKSIIYKEVKLSKEELYKERKMAESKEDYVNAMFKCEKCIISFPNADDLGDHISLKHELNASKHVCTICECSFNSIVSYNYHRKKHKTRYECAVCDERYHTMHTVLKHYGSTHGQDSDVGFELNDSKLCDSKKFEDPYLNNSNNSLERFPCELCDKTFKWKTSLRKHVESHRIKTGQKRKPYCEPCRLSFSTKSTLQKHVKSSSNHQIQLKLLKLKDANCEDPPNPEKQVATIQQIKSSVLKSTQLLRCPLCEQMFQYKGNLHRHIANHAARVSGELVCKPCNRTFSSKATYDQHMKISKKHVSENNFKFVCNECGKRFWNKYLLKDHIDWEHLKNFIHVCNLCEKVFKSKTSLDLHSRAVHKKDGLAHLCDHCGKAYPNQGKLRSHIVALHMNETPYKCGICPAKFNWQTCLSRHVKKVHGTQKRRDVAIRK